MKKLMDILFKKRHFSWAEQFLHVLSKENHLSWLVEKIRDRIEKENPSNITDETKKYGMVTLFSTFSNLKLYSSKVLVFSALLTDFFLWKLCPDIHDCAGLGLYLGLDFNLDIVPLKKELEDKSYFAHGILQVQHN